MADCYAIQLANHILQRSCEEKRRPPGFELKWCEVLTVVRQVSHRTWLSKADFSAARWFPPLRSE